jgi:hypothetical protein
VFEVAVGGGGISWLELTKDPRQRDLKKEDRKKYLPHFHRGWGQIGRVGR